MVPPGAANPSRSRRRAAGRRALALAGLIAATAWAPDARAQPLGGHALRWTRAPGAEGCVDVGTLRAAVERRLHRPVFVDDAAAAVVIDARVAPAPPGWHVTIVVHRADDPAPAARELDEPAADCRALDDELALVLALIVDPDGGRGGPPPPPPPPADPPWQVGVAATVAVARGLVPGVAAGGSLAVTLDAPRLPAAVLHASAWPANEETGPRQCAPAAPSGTLQPCVARVGLVTAGLTVCVPAWRRGAITVDGCGGGMIGRLSARGVNFDHPQSSRQLVGYVVMEPHAAVRLRGALQAEADVGVWLATVRSRPTFDQGGTTLFFPRAPALALVATAGLGLRF